MPGPSESPRVFGSSTSVSLAIACGRTLIILHACPHPPRRRGPWVTAPEAASRRRWKVGIVGRVLTAAPTGGPEQPAGKLKGPEQTAAKPVCPEQTAGKPTRPEQIAANPRGPEQTA